MSWHISTSNSNLTEEFRDHVSTIITREILNFAKVHGVNVYEGLVLKNALYQIMTEILKPAKLPSFYISLKYDSIKCERNECTVKVSSNKLEEFKTTFSTYWGIANKDLYLEKLLIVSAELRVRNLDEDEKTEDYNKKFILEMHVTEIWQNPHLEWDVTDEELDVQ